MAGGFGTFTETKLLNNILRAGAGFSLTNVFFSLHTADPGDTGASEVTAGDYARKSVPATAVEWNAPSGAPSLVDNVNDILFAVATSAWGTITHVGFFDALTVGNFLAGGALTVSKVIQNGDQLKFPAGDLDVTLE